MANRVSSSLYNKTNNNYQNTSSSNNRSSRSTFTTHTYASTNTFNTEPTYTTTPITGDPRTLHSYYVTSSNYRAPRPSPATSLTRHYREYEPSYPSITRYRTPSSSSPFRKTHYLDDSDEEIINEEILEITDLNHYPTLVERWGDDTKTVVRQEGEFKFEDFVEFEETEPTIIEEILYELIYSGDKLKTCRQLDRSRSESRNFRKIKKRRTKRKRQPNDDSSNLTSQANSRDNSGTRSPFYNDYFYSPERSSTPTPSVLSTSWQSTGFLPHDRSSLDIPVRNRFDDQNYINHIRVNESDPIHSYTQVQQYPQTRILSDEQYQTLPTTSINKRATDLLDEMRHLSNQIDTLITPDPDSETYTPIISEEQGITKIQLTPKDEDHKTASLLPEDKTDAINETNEIVSSDRNERLLTSHRATDDDEEQSRANIIDQTSVQKEISREEHDSSDIEKQINQTKVSNYDESEKDDEEHSSATGPTVFENIQEEQRTGKDTDEDASFSENEQILSKSFTSDEQQQEQQSFNAIQTSEESPPSSLLSTNERQDDHEIISNTTESSINKSESQLPSIETQVKQPETMIDRRKMEDESEHEQIQTTEISSPIQQQISTGTKRISSEVIPEISLQSTIVPDDEKSVSTSETDPDLRSFLNSLTTHLLPDLPTSFDDETEDEQSSMSEPKSIEETKEESQDRIPTDQIEPVDETNIQHDEQENKEKSSSIIDTITSAFSTVKETILGKQEPTTEETPVSTDSLVNLVEQMRTADEKSQEQQQIDQNEQETISDTSSIPTDQTSSTALQSRQITTEDTVDTTKPSTVTSPTDIVYQLNSQPVLSSSEEQQKMADTQISTQLSKQEVKLSPTDSSLESTQSVITSEEEEQQQQPISRISSTTETSERTTSIDRQPSVELQSTKEIDDQVSSDSLVNIVRQIRTIPQITRLPSIDDKTETSHIIEQKIEKPSIDSSVEIVQPNESIPNEPVAVKDNRDVLPESSEISFVNETKQETTSEETTKEDETEPLSSEALTEVAGEILATSLTSQLPSDHITTETSEFVEKQDQKPSTDSIDEDVSLQRTSPDLQVTATTRLTTTEERARDELATHTSTTTTQITEQTTSEDKIKEDEAEHLSLDALTETVREILATPRTVQLPSAEIKTDIANTEDSSILSEVDTSPSTLTTITADIQQPSSETETERSTILDHYEEKPSIENLVTIMREIPTTSMARSISRQEASKFTDAEQTDVSTTVQESLEQDETEKVKTLPAQENTETTASIVTTDRQPATNIEETKEEHERTAIDSSFDTVPEILTTPISLQEPADIDVKESNYLDDQPLEKPSIDSLTEVSSSSVTTTEDEVVKPSDIEHSELRETTETSSAKEAAQETVFEDTTKEAETERLSTEALTETVREILATPPTIHLSSLNTTTEEQVEKPTIDVLIPHVEQVTTTEEEIEKPTDTDEDDILETSRTASNIETVQETTSEETTKENEEAVREILATPPTSHLPSVEHTTETITEIEQPDKQTSVDSLTQIAKQIKSMTFSPVRTTTSGEQVVQTTDTTEEVVPEPVTAFSTIESAQEITSEDRPALADDTTKEVEAERLSSEALTEAGPEILSTPPTVHLPSTAVEQETAESNEQPSTDTVVQTTPQTDIIPDQLTTINKITTTTQQSSNDVVGKTEVYEDETSDSLTETVRQILATTPTIHLPSVDSTTEETIARTDEQADKPSTDVLTPHVEQAATTEEEEEEEEPTAKEDEILKTSKTSSVSESVQETTSEETTKEVEAERLSSEALTEVVRDILATPPTSHLPSVEHTSEIEQPSVDSLTQIAEQIKSMTSSPVATTSEEQVVQTADTKAEVVPESTPALSTIETVQETSSEGRPVLADDITKEVEAEHVSSETLSEAVQKTEINSNQPSAIEEINEDETSTKSELPLLPVTTITTPAVEETTTEKQESSSEVKENKDEDEAVSTDSLAETVGQILATSRSVHLPSVDHITESTTSTEQESEKPSGGIFGNIMHQIKEIYHDLTTTSNEASLQKTTPEETEQEISSQQPIPEEELKTSFTKQISDDDRFEDASSTEDISTEKEQLDSTVISSFTTPVEETAREDVQTSVREKTPEDVAERVLTDAIYDAVHEIGATPLASHLSPPEIKTETTETIQQEDEKSAIDSLVQITKQMKTIANERVVPATDIQREALPQPTEISSTTRNLQTTVSEDRQSSTDDTTQEVEAEHLPSVQQPLLSSSNEAQQQIYVTDRQSPIPQETSEQEVVTEIDEPVLKSITTTTAVVEEITPEVQQLPKEDQGVATDSLIETVRQILSAPVSVHLPSIDSTTEETTTYVKKETEKPSDVELSTRFEENQGPTAIKQDDTLESSQASPVTETVQQTASEDPQPSTVDTTKEGDAERLSSVEHTTETATEIEQPSVDSLTQIAEQIKSMTSSPVTTTYVPDVSPESTKTSLITETKQETTSDDTAKETEADNLSSPALTEAVREILATPPSVHLPSVDSTAEEKVEEAPLESFTPRSEEITTIVTSPVTIAEEEKEKPTDTNEDEILKSSKASSVFETVQEITSEDHQRPVKDATEEVEAEHLSSEALTEVVREILTTPVTIHSPSVDVKSDTAESIDQQSKESFSTNISETAPESVVVPDQLSVLQDTTQNEVPAKVEESLFKKTTTITTTVEKTPTGSQETSDDVKEIEEDGTVQTDSLAETVRQILATPVSIHLPSVDHTTESTPLIEQEVGKSSADLLTETSELNKTRMLPTAAIDAPVSQPTVTTEEEHPELSTASSVTEIKKETVSEDHGLTTEDKTKEDEAEHLSSDALTEAVREILATPPTVHLPSVDSTTEETTTRTGEQVEKPATEAVTPHAEQGTTTTEEKEEEPTNIQKDEISESSKTSSVVETIQETTSEETTKEDEAERLSSAALTEAVREILGTPPTVHLPSVDSTTEEITTLTEEQVEKPTTEIVTPHIEQVTTTEEEKEEEEPTAKEHEILKTSKTSSVSESVQETTSEEITKEVEAERLSSEALTEAVREILATPPTSHLPPVDSTTEETVTHTDEQVEKPTTETVTPHVDQVTTTEEEEEATTNTQKDEILESSKTSSVAETILKTTSEETTKEDEAERLSSAALTEVVREILATPPTVHLPSVEHTTETITETEQPSVDSLTQIAEQIKSMTSLSATTSEEPVVQTTDTEEEVTPESTIALSRIETVEETTSEETTQENETERLSSEALTDAVRDILATPRTAHLSSIHSTTEETTTSTEEQAEQPSTETLVPHYEAVTTTEEEEERKQPVDPKNDEILEPSKTSSVTEAVQDTASEDHQSSTKDTTKENEAEYLSSEALTDAVRQILSTPLTVHLPSVDIRTETTETTEQPLSTTSSKTVEKIDEVSSEPILAKAITTTTVVEDTTTENQQTTDEVKKQREEETPVSSDSLAETVRQILATPVTVHLPSIETEVETTTDIAESSDKKITEEQSDSSPAVVKTEDEQKTTTAIRQPSLEETVPSTSVVDDKVETTVQSEEVKPSSDSLVEIVHPVFNSPVQSTFDMEAKKNETPSVQPPVEEESIEKETLTTGLISSEFHPVVPTVSVSSFEDDSLQLDDNNQSTSSSLYVTADNLVTDAIVDAPLLLEQSTPVPSDNPSLYVTADNLVTDAIVDAPLLLEQSAPIQSDNQSVLPLPSTDDASKKTDTDIESTTDIVTESHDDYSSTSGLTNIVHSILNLPNEISPESSLPHEDNQIIISPKSNFDEQVNTTELTNIVDTTTKTLNTQTQSSEEPSVQRASAVKPTLIIDNPDDDDDDNTTADHVATFFVPGTPTPSEGNFRELYDHRYFVSTTTDEPALQFIPTERQGSLQSTTPSEERKSIPESPLAYYELQEQRHSLMSPQQSLGDEKEETTSPALTTWTTIQPLIDFEEKEEKQETSDINLDDHAYEYARRFDLESPSVISNLPTSEYRQVFGISDEIVNTVDDMTYHIAETLSKELENNPPSTTIDEVKSLTSESDETVQLDEDVQPSLSFKDESVSVNVKRITEALDALESDLLEQKDNIQIQPSPFATIDESSIQKQEGLESDRLATTLEDQSIIIPSQDELIDEDLLPKKIEQETADQEPKEEVTSNNEVDSRYSTLLDRIDSLEKPLLDLPSSTSEKETITTEATEESDDDRQLHQRYDTLIEHVNTLEEATNQNLTVDTTDSDKQIVTLPSDEPIITSQDEKSTESDITIDGLAQTMAQILATPFRTVLTPYEKLAHEEQMDNSGLETALEQILATTQFQTINTKLTAPVDRIAPSEEFKDRSEEIQRTEPEEETTTEEKDSSSLFDKVTPIATNVISSITTTVPTITISEEPYVATDSGLSDEEDDQSQIPTTVVETTKTTESTINDEKALSPVLSDDETLVSKSSEDQETEESDKQEQTSSTGLLEIMKNFLPLALRSTKSDVIGSEEQSSTVENEQQQETSSPVADYSTSNDVDHPYKPVEPVVEDKDTSSIIDRATSIVKSAISSVTNALPASKTTEETTLTTEPTVSEDEVSVPTVTEEEEIVVSRPSAENEVVDEKQPSSTGLLEMMKSFLPSALRTTKPDVVSFEEPIAAVIEDQEATPASYTTETTSTQEVSQENLSQSIEPTVESEEQGYVSSPVPGFFSSSDVYHAYKQPVEPVIEEKDSSSITDKATSLVSDIISSATSALPTSKTTEDTLSLSDTSSSSEQDTLSQDTKAVVTTTATTKSMTSDEELPSAVLAEERSFVSKPSEITETEEAHEEQKQQPSSTGLLEMMKSFLPSALRTTKPDVVSSEEPISASQADQEATPSSYTTETTATQEVSQENLSQSIEPTVESEEQGYVSSPVPGFFSSSDIYHAYKQPVEPVIEEEDSSSITDKATSLVSDIISSATSALSTSKTTEDTLSLSDTNSSSEQKAESESETAVEKTTEITQSTISDDKISPSTVEEKEIVISKPFEESETKVEEVTPQPSSTGLFDIMKSFIPSAIRPKTSLVTSSKEQIPTTDDDQKLLLSSTLETTTSSEIIEEYPVESTQATTQIQEPEEISDEISGDTTGTDVSDAEAESKEQVVEEQDSTSVISRLTSIVTGAISAVQHALPTSITSSTDTHQQESPAEDDKIEISESTLQTKATDEQEHQGIFDPIKQTGSNVQDTLTSLASSEEKPTTSESSSNLPKESTENQSEISNIDEEKDTLIETSKEILATPLQSAVDTYEKIVSTQEEPTSPSKIPAKVTTSDYPWFANQYKIADSEIERLSATDQPSIAESNQQEMSTTITSTSNETESQDQSEEQSVQQLQVINDDYPWYSSYYTIADADASVGELYNKLSYTIKQLDQRPPSTTVEFQPEPHEKVTTSDYDRQALSDTKDTREKVHELAQLSTQLTTTTINVSQDEQGEDEEGFQVVQRRKRIPSSTTHEKTPPPTTITTQAFVSPDINLTPVVLHGQPSIPVTPPIGASETTTTTTTPSTSRKQKQKKQKKDKKETIFFDAPMPSTSDSNEQKSETVQTSVVEELIETTKSELLSSPTTDDSSQIDQTSEEMKDESKPKVTETKRDEEQAEPLSTSVMSDIEEIKQVDDEKNDSTSSDASQWFTSSFTTFPEDTKVKTQTSEQTIVTETTTTVPLTDYEVIQPELPPIPSSTQKKKTKRKSTDEGLPRQPEIPPSPPAVEESKVQSEPAPSTPVKTITTTVRSKVVTPPKQEQEVEDNEGFQLVRYRKRVPSVTGPEKTPPPSSTNTFKQSFSPDSDQKAAVTQGRQSSSASIITPSPTTVTPTTTTKKKPKKEKKDIFVFDASLSSPSTDTDIISSSSIDSSKTKRIEQRATDQQRKSSDTAQPKSLFSSLLTSSSVPSLNIEENTTQQSANDQETILQSQIPSLSSPSITESNVQSKSVLPPTKSTITTLRVKASTSPDEEEEDNEGFQVVRHRKRISSAPRPEKSLPPLPTKPSYKQNFARDINLKPVVIHGRHGSESRSMPRTTTGGQSSSNKRQQTRPKQDRPQIPPFSAQRSPVSQETQIMSSPGIENKRTEQARPPVGDKRQRLSDSTFQPSFIEQTAKQIEQQPSTDIERQTILPTGQRKSSDPSPQQTVTGTKTEQLSTKVSAPIDKSIQEIVQEYHVPTKEEINTATQQTSIKETVPPAAIGATTTLTQKSTFTGEDDDDGFRVVRYRKHTPSSTPTAPISKQHSFGSDTERKPTNIPRKQSSPPSITVPTSIVSQTTIPKKKPAKPKKTKEESGVSRIPQSLDILSSSTTDTDFASSSIEDFKNQTTTTYTPPIPESQSISDDVFSPRSEKEGTTTTYDIITTEGSESVQKTSNETQNDVQPIESTVSPTVESADTSEESSKKPKKKHKRLKRIPAGSELSTPSDEVSSTLESSLTTKPLSSTSSSHASVTDLPSVSSQIEEISEPVTTTEETLPSPSIEPTTNVVDEQVTALPSKQSTKRRKKKAHSTEKSLEEESVLSSSTTSTTDKDSSSAAATTPVKETSLESTTKSRLISNDDKQDSEWITAQNEKSTVVEPTITSPSNEQQLSSSFPAHSQLITPKILPEKVTDVQFEFNKSGELTMTSQSSLERTPTEWGTVKFLSEEQDLSQPDKLEPSTEQTLSQQLTTEQESLIEQTTDLTPHIDTEMKTETSTKSIESSETGGEAHLDAYRDPTGRLRRKKPRKHTSHSTKSEDTSSTLEQQTTEEHKFDRKSISEHWADVIARPIVTTDEEDKIPSELVPEEQSLEDEDTSETSSKLDSFLPDYIRQQIKTSSAPRSRSSNDDRSKSSSTDLSTSFSQSQSTRVIPPSSNQSTSADTSENESRKQLQESLKQEHYSRENSNVSSTINQTESDVISTSSSLPSTDTTRKKKQRPKMLKKDIEAKTLLTHEFDDTPLTITEVQQTSPVTQKTTEDETEHEQSFLSSIRHQFTSAISTISDSFTSALSSAKQTTTDEQSTLQSDEPVPIIEEATTISPATSSESTTTTTKKSSTRSPRKRSKRDSGPDYETLTLQPSGDMDQSSADKKTITTTPPTFVDENQVDSIKVEPHKQQLRQRTSSGRQTANTEEENEQQAILADDEGDEDIISKPAVSHGTASGTHTRTSSESSIETQDLPSTTIPKQEQQQKQSATEELESITQIPDELQTDKEETTADQQTTITEPLRSVQGFHTFTPNIYQYNQYEEGPTLSTESPKSPITETEPTDTVLSRGFSLWLQQGKDNESSSSSKKEEQQQPLTTGSGLTRALQSLVIQPVESENEDDDEEEEDSWNGPRATKPTYTTGIRAEKRIHTTSGYNINHPRSTATTPSWLISPSTDNTYPDDSSKFDPDDDEEDNSIDDSSDKQQLPPTINTQLSTTEERQRHLNNLADLTFQSTISNLSSSSSSSLSSAAKWTETSIRSDDTNQQQTSFTEDDVQRCLGEDFYRESLAADILPTEQRTITSLDELVLKPSQLSEDLDDDDDDDDNDNQKNRNNNNNNQSINFDEWAHFLERQNNKHLFLSSPIEQTLSTSHECSYARVLDDDTLISDAERSDLTADVQHVSDIDRQRYGDFSSLNDDVPVPESTINPPLSSSNPEPHVSHRSKPSETFQRWRKQSNRDRESSTVSHQTSPENQNDDEIIISHSEGGLSRQVRPSS